MKRTLHRLRRRGPVDRRMAVRPQYPWYLKLLAAVLLLALGYGLAYWQFSKLLARAADPLQNEAVMAQIALAERQLQVERSTHTNAAKEMALLQDEIMRLKEDVAFYKGILAERGGPDGLKFQGVKVSRGPQDGQYHYQVGLAQAGRTPIRGSLRLTVQGTQDGKSVSVPAAVEGQSGDQAIDLGKSRQVGGNFNIPAGLHPQNLLVEFFEIGEERPRLSQMVSLSG